MSARLLIRSFLNLNEVPLETLPESIGPNWLLWEQTVKDIPSLLSSGSLRNRIDNVLPEIHFNEIASFPEIVIERVYTMMCFIAHAYIRGAPGESMIKKLPKKIAQVWVDAARALDLPPISTYASTVTFNVNFKHNPKCLDELGVVFNSTGSKDEEWFYVVSAGIDLESEAVIKIAERMKWSLENVDECLSELNLIIKRLTGVLNRMYEQCDPMVFYHEIRRFFAGWLNDPLLDGHGLVYELDSGDVYFNLAGGSAAQTATIQLIDIMLSIDHDHQSNQETFLEGKMKKSYSREMRSYMPKSHRAYLAECEEFFSRSEVRNVIETSPAFQECIKSLADFRNDHIIMVARYIVSQAAKSKQTAYGTGGSNPIPFLKQFRDDTNEKLQNKK